MNIRARRTAGAVVWFGSVVVALGWGALDGAAVEGTGYGFAPPVNLAALETARVLDMPVQLHDQVGADQIVVHMDAQPVEEERLVAQAQLLAVQEDASLLAMNDSRRFAEGLESSAVNRAKLSAVLQEDLAMAQTLDERLSIEADLAGTGASSTQAVEEWRRQLRVVQARIGANRNALAIATGAAEQAQARNADLVEPGRWSAVAMTRTVEMLEGRISRMDLKAGIDGQITWIYRTAGEVVPAGEPVVQVRPMGTTQVVAFLSPASAVGLEAGADATVKRATGEVVHGHLRSVGAGPQPLPMHLWKLPEWPEYGVPIVVDVDVAIAPDEPVVVRL